jgi:hypothetical protein
MDLEKVYSEHERYLTDMFKKCVCIYDAWRYVNNERMFPLMTLVYYTDNEDNKVIGFPINLSQYIEAEDEYIWLCKALINNMAAQSVPFDEYLSHSDEIYECNRCQQELTSPAYHKEEKDLCLACRYITGTLNWTCPSEYLPITKIKRDNIIEYMTVP